MPSPNKPTAPALPRRIVVLPDPNPEAVTPTREAVRLQFVRNAKNRALSERTMRNRYGTMLVSIHRPYVVDITAALRYFPIDYARKEGAAIQQHGCFNRCGAAHNVGWRTRPLPVGGNRDHDANIRLRDHFRMRALEQFRHGKEEPEIPDCLASRVRVAASQVRLDAIAPCQHRVAPPPIFPNQRFERHRRESLQAPAALIEKPSVLLHIPVPIHFLLVVVLEGGASLRQQYSGVRLRRA